MTRPDLRYTDLLYGELASLAILVVALLVLGVVPAVLLGPDTMATATHAVTESFAWNK